MLFLNVAFFRTREIILRLMAVVFVIYIIYILSTTISFNLMDTKIGTSKADDYYDLDIHDQDASKQRTDEAIDIVYTWVNGSDPQFCAMLDQYLNSGMNNKSEFNKELGCNIFDYKQELKFSLRSVELYAPWIRHVFIVTNDQVPTWLNLSYEKVSIVTLDQIFLNKSNLPSFSSPAIESALHRIPGLSKRFIYFNDNIFLGQPITRHDFMTSHKECLIYMEPRVVSDCAPKCSCFTIINGDCDAECYKIDCQYNASDCVNETVTDKPNKLSAYDASLQFVQSLYNSAYGLRARHIPTHTPHMVDRDIMYALQRKFPQEYAVTESNRIRSGNDMQYMFSYCNYLIDEKKVLNISEIFDQYDIDHSNTWSENEIRRIPFTKNERIKFSNIVVNCTNQSDTNFIKKELVFNCSALTEFLIQKFRIQPKYKYKVQKNTCDRTYSYLSLISNETTMEQELNTIKIKPSKFICINDDLTSDNATMNERRKLQILGFYLFFFPGPSKFELSEIK